MQKLTFFLLVIPWLVFGGATLAQSPTAQQIETFKNLPADQRKTLIDSFGGGGADGTAYRDAPLTTPSTLTQIPAETQNSGPPRIRRRSTIILNVSTIDEDTLDEESTTKARRERIIAGNPYRLDDDGSLSLPSLPVINLLGLTDAQAAQLLNADPRLPGLRFNVTLLPVELTGMAALKRFGSDLFDQIPTTFAPATDIPVPPDYRIGPGDNVVVDLFGKKSGRYQLIVDRNGTLTLPGLGPMNVAGLSFDQLREDIEQRINSQMIGVRASVTMGELRSIRVFVLGDVVRAGSYTVSALSTVTNALFASGGITSVGSFRNIEIKRSGRSIARFDLYDLLLRGDTSNDVHLEQGDAIFVPPVGNTAGIGGRVRRPAIYEFRNGTTVGELLDMSGGLTSDADPRRANIERISTDHERVVVNVDLSSSKDRATKLLAGDIITVSKVANDMRGVMLEGYVHRPGAQAWRQGMRLSDLLGSLQAMKVNADQRYLLIRREHLPDRRVEVLSADALEALSAPGSQSDPVLMSGDRVMVFSRQPDRGPALGDLVRELRLQTRDNQAVPVVSIGGRVRSPGEYPLERGMTIADLLRAGGGLDDAAYRGTAELTRYEVVGNESRKTEVLEISLSDVASGASGGQTELHPYDRLIVKETPDWRGQESIVLAGEVRFPGTYPIRTGETLSSVVRRAGGLTDAAFAEGTVFTREEIRAQERQQLDTLAKRLQSDLAFLAAKDTSDETAKASAAAGNAVLAELRAAKPIGRLVIDLKRAISDRSHEDDLELRDGDKLIIPRIKQYVTVIGEVQNPTSHVWRRSIDRDEYIERSGGLSTRADVKRIYVVRADGSVATNDRNRWFGGEKLEPGDTIVVPIDAKPSRALPILQSVTTIMYNLAVAVAAVGSL